MGSPRQLACFVSLQCRGSTISSWFRVQDDSAGVVASESGERRVQGGAQNVKRGQSETQLGAT
jgi:hypothetical protein